MPPPKKRLKSEHTSSASTLHSFFLPSGSDAGKSNNSNKSARKLYGLEEKRIDAFPEVIVISDDDEDEFPGSAQKATMKATTGTLLMKAESKTDLDSAFTTAGEIQHLGQDFETLENTEVGAQPMLDPVIPLQACTPPPPTHRPRSRQSAVSSTLCSPSKEPLQIIDTDASTLDNASLIADDEVEELLDEDYEDDDDGGEIQEIFPPRWKGKGKCLGSVLLDETKCATSCPICGCSFDGWEEEIITQHVNSCLDDIDQVFTTEGTSSRPHAHPLAPITSFQPQTPAGSKRPNAFSLLMSSRKENNAWKAAEVDFAKPDSAIGKARKAEGRRKAPFYKVMQGMPIAVDAFRYGKIPGVTSYLLTHAHSDHYTNLSSNWKNGPIYCSYTTANLIKLMLGVDPKWIHPLPFDKPTILPDTGGVEVTLLEANHCPGSCLFLFKGSQTANAGDSDFTSPYVGSSKVFRYLHCGDFRASPRHVLHPAIKGQKLDIVYLDTTYLNAKYCFPPQKQVIEACAELAKQLVSGEEPSLGGPSQPSVGRWLKTANGAEVKAEVKDEDEDFDYEASFDVKQEMTEECVDGAEEWDVPPEPPSVPDEKPELRLIKDGGLPSTGVPVEKRPLVMIGTYSIGKERIVKAVAKALGTKVYCDSRKRSILLCQDDPELREMLAEDPYTAQVHLVPLGTISSDRIEPYYTRFASHYDSVIGFRPTGWTFSAPAGTDLLPNIAQVVSRNQSRNFTPSSLKPMRNSTAKYRLYGVPYSEHSSFFELTCFALSVDVVQIIATVNVGSARSRGVMTKWFEKWEAERKKRWKEGKERIIPYRDLDYW